MYKQIVALGDSLTQLGADIRTAGWVAQIQNTCTGKIDILNRGLSGYTTRYVRIVLPQLKIDWNEVLFVTILLGSNDSCIPDQAESRNVPISEYTINLREIINYVLAQGIAPERIILITPPPVDEVREEEICKTRRHTNDLTKIYAETVTALAAEAGTKLIHLYAQMMSIPNWKSFLSDGLHLSRDGNQLLYEEVNKLIAPVVAATSSCFPPYTDIDPQHPELMLTNLST